jgi:CubicO group peptidase (beta-lactamase class C family)
MKKESSGWCSVAGRCAIALVLGGGGAAGAAEPKSERTVSIPLPSAGDVRVVEALKPIRLKYKLPAIAGAIVTSKGATMLGVVGVRKAGTDVAAAVGDQWHLGSETKAMTATVIASLVEQGKLKWGTVP